MEGYVTRTEAAKELDVSISTFDRLRASGKIATYYFSAGIPRFSLQELYEYAASSRVVRTKETRSTRKKTTHRAPVAIAWRPGEKLV